jgi:hypothetical protein
VLDHGLPGTMIDLVRDGVDRRELAGEGSRAIWNALVRVAASALQRGWTQAQWQALLDEPASYLGTQAKIGKRGKAKTRRDHQRSLDAAWQQAQRWVAEHPAPYTRVEAIQHAVEQAAIVTGMIDDLDISEHEREILRYAAKIAERNGSLRPALPRRELEAATGLGHTALAAVLARMESAGLLRLYERGRPRKPNAEGSKRKPRASLYALPATEALRAHQYPVNRVCGPEALVCGPEASPGSGPGALVCGPPTKGNTAMPAAITLTLSSVDPDALAATVSALAERRDLRVEETPDHVPSVSPGRSDNVRPLRRDRRDSA